MIEIARLGFNYFAMWLLLRNTTISQKPKPTGKSPYSALLAAFCKQHQWAFIPDKRRNCTIPHLKHQESYVRSFINESESRVKLKRFCKSTKHLRERRKTIINQPTTVLNCFWLNKLHALTTFTKTRKKLWSSRSRILTMIESIRE